MRWERLFADLEAQYDAADAQDLAAEIADRSRREAAMVSAADRLRASSGPVSFGLPGHSPVTGEVLAVGGVWVLVDDRRSDVLVLLPAVVWLRGLPPHSVSERSAVAARLDLAYVLRGIARDRANVAVLLRDGSVATGTIDRVGRDFLDLAEHDVDDVRRADAVNSTRALPFTALAAVRRR